MAVITAATVDVGANGQWKAAQGTITADKPALNTTATWNSAGVTFTHLKANVTDTASAAASLLMDLQLGGVSKFKADKSGNITAAGLVTAASGFSGTLVTAAQPQITSLGTLTGLAVDGVATVTATTGTQFSVKYDGSNHLGVDVSSAGIVTYTATGAGSAHVFPSRVRTASGSQSANDNTATTLFALPGAGMFKVVAYIAGSGDVYHAEATYVHDGTNASLKEANNGANMFLTLSGTNVQGRQTSGGSANITFIYLRIA